jgi:KGK domain
MSDRFESLEGGEVVSIHNEAEVLSGHKTFKSSDLSDAIKSYVANAIPGWSEDKNDWFTDRGIDCEALRFGSKGWQKGRIRVSLEFCPDESDLAALGASNSSVPTGANMPQSSVDTPLTLASHPASAALASEEDRLMSHSASTVLEHEEDRVMLEAVMPTPVATSEVVIPVAGIAATSAVAAAMAMTSPDLQTVSGYQPIPHHTDTVLEPEHHDSSSPHSGGLDEIAFDFDLANNDRGRMIPNGLMELDVADGLDFSEHDLLSFEANGMSAAAEGFGSFQDLERPENSGMLIDEVWNEMDRGNWPKIS